MGLVLQRKPGQSVVIGGGIKVTVVAGGERVKLLIEAPSNVPIHREEIWDRIESQKANRGAWPAHAELGGESG